jgi:hypothetical protein
MEMSSQPHDPAALMPGERISDTYWIFKETVWAPELVWNDGKDKNICTCRVSTPGHLTCSLVTILTGIKGEG